MKPVVTRLYTLFVALALVGFLVWSAADWVRSRDQAMVFSQSHLRHLAGSLSDESVRGKAADSSTFAPLLQSLFGQDSRWKMLLLTSPERGTEYYRGPHTTVAPDKQVPSWEPRLFTEISLSLPVFRSGKDPMTIQAIYEFLGPHEAYVWFRALGFTLLTLLILTTLLVLLSLRGWDEPARRQPAAEPHSPLPSADDVPQFPSRETSSKPASDFAVDDDYWFEEEMTLDDLPPLDSPRLEPSPPTALPERSLGESLTALLSEAAAAGQDLAVLSVSSREPSNQAWTGSVHEFFSEEGAAFDRDRGVTVVLRGRGIDEALSVSRVLVDTLEQKRPGAEVHVGVSSRNGRTVDAEVLLAEADSARRRSLSGTIRVMGLKSDPERYQQHLAALAAGHHL